ncbi:peptidase C39 family protein [Pontiellaceae bacterium B1224]|nr:peptidase C39 family protein [Pontiellaceae bacterium B1224]
MKKLNLILKPATLDHLDALMTLEEKCFETDRLSRRSMRRFITGDQSIFLTALSGDSLAGYLLIIFYRGTRLARLYSLAVDPDLRGQGISKKLLKAGEAEALNRGAIHFRLEVAPSNDAALQLYRSFGFKDFGRVQDYYEDHTDALRMQKRIRHIEQSTVHINIPWLGQNTPFSCGPAALMMAMAGLDRTYKPDLKEELRLWRETTTIYMTSGHGGCHPIGLALAAKRRGFSSEIWLNKRGPLFVEGVRSENKKKIMQIVHTDFEAQSRKQGIKTHHRAVDPNTLRKACDEGAIPVVLISTYRLDRKKAPHWVVVSGYDEHCFYVHDPDFDATEETPRDLQYIPIAVEDFDSMSSFGSTRLRCAIILSASKQN